MSEREATYRVPVDKHPPYAVKGLGDFLGPPRWHKHETRAAMLKRIAWTPEEFAALPPPMVEEVALPEPIPVPEPKPVAVAEKPKPIVQPVTLTAKAESLILAVENRERLKNLK